MPYRCLPLKPDNLNSVPGAYILGGETARSCPPASVSTRWQACVCSHTNSFHIHTYVVIKDFRKFKPFKKRWMSLCLFYGGECFACTCVWISRACPVAMEVTRRLGIPWDCEPPCGCWEVNPGLLEEERGECLTAASALQSHEGCFVLILA